MEPVTGTYRGYKIISSPLPSSGGTHVIEALNIMENFDIASMGFDSAEKLHIMTEAFKMCFHDRETGFFLKNVQKSWQHRLTRL